MDKLIYLDHSATTYVKEEVMERMKPYFTNYFGNASSTYLLGRVSKYAINGAREMVAKVLNCSANEIYFTSCGSESNNWALMGVAQANSRKGNHIITSNIEHHSIIRTCEYLEREGCRVTYLPVNKQGIISLDDLQNSITDQTILISIMHANNEIGTIQPIEEINRIAKHNNIYFHTDAVQAVGNIPIDLTVNDFDLLSLSAHKFYGPKGIAVLYVRSGVEINPFIFGGAQEQNRRAGTENTAGIIGLASALELGTNNIDERSIRIKYLRDEFVKGIMEKIPGVNVNGDLFRRLPGNANLSFDNVNNLILIRLLDERGIAVSSGSACSCGSSDASHVLLAIGLSNEQARAAVRFSFGEENTIDDVNYVLEVLPGIIDQLRC